MKKRARAKQTIQNQAKERTLEILKDMPLTSFALGYCCLKSEDGRFGRITVGDASEYKAIVREMESDKILASYSSFKELVEAGWVVD